MPVNLLGQYPTLVGKVATLKLPRPCHPFDVGFRRGYLLSTIATIPFHTAGTQSLRDRLTILGDFLLSDGCRRALPLLALANHQSMSWMGQLRPSV